MCLKPKPLGPIPEDTLQLGQKLLSEDNLMRRIGDKYAELVKDEEFADMYSHTGKPALSPARLSLVVVQAIEHLSDRAAAMMVRTRIDWKYALHLPLSDEGFDESVLSEFRQRLVARGAQRRLFDALLERLKGEGLLKGRGLQRTDSLSIIGAVRELNRLELVMETMRLALEAIAELSKEWLKANTLHSWIQSYGEWTQAERLVKESGPAGKAQTQRLLIKTGEDGFALLEALGREETPRQLKELEAVKILQRVWTQQYRRVEREGEQVQIVVEMSTAESGQADAVEGDLIASPHDPQVRYSNKRGNKSTGHKLHWTETAAEDAPMIVTDVEVVKGASYEGVVLEAIHERLKKREVLPKEHLVDSAYVSGETIVESGDRGVELTGPLQQEKKMQQLEERSDTNNGKELASTVKPKNNLVCSNSVVDGQIKHLAVKEFRLDFDKKVAFCPAGQLARALARNDKEGSWTGGGFSILG